MQRDRERIVVDAPQLLEEQLRLPARVDEEQRRLVRLDRLVDLGQRIERRVPLPRHARSSGSRIERSGAAPPSTTILSARRRGCARLLRDQPGAEIVRLGDGGGKADRLQPRRELSEPREIERQKVAALRDDERMQLVEDHRLEPPEEAPRVLRGKQQRHLLRRGEQDVRRIELLALPLVDRRVAGARLEPDRQAHLGDRHFEVAVDVDRERLQRRDVERVRPDDRLARLRRFARLAPARSTRLGRKPASVFPAPVGAISSTERPGLRLRQKLDLMRPRRPAALREPAAEGRRQKRRRSGRLERARSWNRGRTAGSWSRVRRSAQSTVRRLCTGACANLVMPLRIRHPEAVRLADELAEHDRTRPSSQAVTMALRRSDRCARSSKAIETARRSFSDDRRTRFCRRCRCWTRARPTRSSATTRTACRRDRRQPRRCSRSCSAEPEAARLSSAACIARDGVLIRPQSGIEPAIDFERPVCAPELDRRSSCASTV